MNDIGNDFWFQAQGVYSRLCEPVHGCCLRSRECTPQKNGADLSGGCAIILNGVLSSEMLDVAFADFQDFMRIAMEAEGHSYKIIVSVGESDDWPCDAAEAFHIYVSLDSCEILARNPVSIIRALVYLEDEMTRCCRPFLKIGKQTRWSTITERITRSPIAAYRWKTGWELIDDNDYYPDEYLNHLTHCGINGIWVAGLFRTLISSDVLPELGPAEHRLEKLKALVTKTARYGIKVYFLCIEPRSVTPDHPVFKAHPEIQGATIGNDCSLCTSTPLVQEYIRQSTCELFREVPQLGGIINLFNGERLTNCWLDENFAATCNRCSTRAQVDVLAEDLECFVRGIEQAGSDASLYAWPYWIDTTDSLKLRDCGVLLDLIRQSHPKIVWLGNFEHGGKKEICNKQITIDEYSLSYAGPCDAFNQIAQAANISRHRVCSKLQIGTSYELSSMPYLPIPGRVFDKIQTMKLLNVTGTMLSWIPGGFPSVMLKAVGEATICGESLSKQEFLHELARIYTSGENAQNLVNAWEKFELAIDEYPFTNRFLYFSPITRAPAYPLLLTHEKSRALPYNWGLDKDRNPQPFEEDLAGWFGPFSCDEIVQQLQKMVLYWQDGLVFLTQVAQDDQATKSLQEMLNVSQVLWGQLKSTLNVIRFLHTRRLLFSELHAETDNKINLLRSILTDELANVEGYLPNVEKDPAIGFQSEIMGYSFTPETIKKKIELTGKTLEHLDEWRLYSNKEIESPILMNIDENWDVDHWGD